MLEHSRQRWAAAKAMLARYSSPGLKPWGRMIVVCQAPCAMDGYSVIMLCRSQGQQVAAGAIVGERRRPGKRHGDLRGLLAPVFAQARLWLTAFAYVGALRAGPSDHKSCWPLADVPTDDTQARMAPR